MKEHTNTAIVGGGQPGLAVSYYLTRLSGCCARANVSTGECLAYSALGPVYVCRTKLGDSVARAKEPKQTVSSECALCDPSPSANLYRRHSISPHFRR